MEHQEALREMSVERYLLGELTGAARERFEEHLFDCEQCAADVKSGVLFLGGARTELATSQPARIPVAQKARRPLRSLLSPAWLVPALAASLLAVAYQSFVALPHLQQELAQADSPAILHTLVLTGGVSRGDEVPKITAPSKGSFLLSVDIPAESAYARYICSLYAPTGAMVWQGSVAPAQTNDAVEIRIPSSITGAGENTLLVQGVPQGGSAGARPVELVRHRFVLELEN